MSEFRGSKLKTRLMPVMSWATIALSVPLLINCNGAKYDETKKSDSPKSQPAKVTPPLPEPHGRLEPRQILRPSPTPSTSSRTDRRERSAPGMPGDSMPPSQQNPGMGVPGAGGSNPNSGPVITQGPTLPDCDSCYRASIKQSTESTGNSVDLLFVVDSSGSMKTVNAKVAQSLDQYISRLPRGTDVNIAVLPAHGTTSAWSGRLFQAGNEPVVLKSKELSASELRNQLMLKLEKVPNDRDGSDGGEMGLFSLSQALESNVVASHKTYGMFRHEAALSIVFVSDEDDICSISMGDLPGRKVMASEQKAFDRDCRGISPRSIYDKLLMMKSGYINGSQVFTGAVQPVSISGIVYSDLQTLAGSQVQGAAKHEIGYGYLEMIAMNNGQAVDLARSSNDIGSALNQIAGQTVSKMKLKTEFSLNSQAGGVLRPSSVCAVIDGQLVPTQVIPSRHQMNLQYAGRAGSNIEVYYCDEKDSTVAAQNLQNDQPTAFVINSGCQDLIAAMKRALSPSSPQTNAAVQRPAPVTPPSPPVISAEEEKQARRQRVMQEESLVNDPSECPQDKPVATAVIRGNFEMMGYKCERENNAR